MAAQAPARRAPIRPTTRPTRLVRLRALACNEEVVKRLRRGDTLADTARFIQVDCAEYNDVTLETLINHLQDYRAELVSPAEFAATHAPRRFQSKVEEFVDGVDELSELSRLYEMQLDRIQREVQTEQKIGKNFSTTAQEFHVARALLGDIHKVKIAVGLSEGNLGTLTINADLQNIRASHMTETAAATLADPRKRMKILSAIRRITQARGIIDVEAAD